MRPLTIIFFSFLTNKLISQDTLLKKPERFSLHMQETTVSQYRPSFHASYTGEHSQLPAEEWATTITSSLFAGLRLWKQAQVFVNPEIAGGSGLSSAFGIASFSNGEAFRVGSPKPTIYLARAYFRQLIPLSTEREWQEDGTNSIAQNIPTKYISLTLGKISIADYFDANNFSHDPRTQFLSWAMMSNGAWDYPANTRGYTPSFVIEYVTKKIELRYGFSMMPKIANGNIMDENIQKANANTVELKYKYHIGKQNGKISLLAFYNNAFMGSYSASNLEYIPDTNAPGTFSPYYDISLSRQYGHSKYGLGINLEHSLTDNLGFFARASYNDGKNETWCFTEIDRSLSLGFSQKGKAWKRKNDVFGLAYCVSGISKEHHDYLAKGGLGFIIGDGQLNYAPENFIETYYSISLVEDKITASLVYQFVVNPAYNKDRGPLTIYSVRLHFSI